MKNKKKKTPRKKEHSAIKAIGVTLPRDVYHLHGRETAPLFLGGAKEATRSKNSLLYEA